VSTSEVLEVALVAIVVFEGLRVSVLEECIEQGFLEAPVEAMGGIAA